MMNEKAKELGAVTAKFENPNGLDDIVTTILLQPKILP